ncbi:MAG: TlpA family protein disulfide reductase, partial [Bacteroidales bacterium]|nr:TlpA family protein disulfide reductase [Bacteroidales bacterium]
VRTIVIDGQKAKYAPIKSLTMPDYPTKDLRPGFADSHYRIDSVTIVGWLRNLPSNRWSPDVSVSLGDFLLRSSVEYKGTMDQEGRFKITFPVLNSTEVYFDWGRATVMTVVEPGKTYFLMKDFSTKQVLFMGEDCRVQNEILTYGPARPLKISNQTMGKDSAAISGLEEYKKWAADNKSDVQAYVAAHPNVSDRFIYYKNIYFDAYECFHIGMARYNFTERKLPQEYMDYMTARLWKNPCQPYTLCRDYRLWLGYYTSCLQQGKERSTTRRDFLSMARLFYGGELEVIDSLKGDPMLLQLLNAGALLRYMDHDRVALDSMALQYVNDSIALEGIRQRILSEHEKYLAIQNRDISSHPSIGRNEVVEGLTEGADILDKIVEPYRGRYILVDFWGTWCDPCKRRLAVAHQQHEQLKDYNLVYLYLCNHSSDVSWQNVIKLYDLLGDNIIHYNLPYDQQSAIEKMLKVRSFPSYFIIGPDGKVLTENVSRQLDHLPALLDDLKQKQMAQ